MAFPLHAAVRVANKRQALSLFNWAYTENNVPCMKIIQATVSDAEQWGVPIEELDLTVSAYNRLKAAGANVIGQVIIMTASEVRDLHKGRVRMTQLGFDDLVEQLKKRGLRLAKG